MLLEVVTQHSGYSDPYVFKVNHFQSVPMNLKSSLVLEGNWTFIAGDFDKFRNDADISIYSSCMIKHKYDLIINCKMFYSSTANECKHCGNIVEDGSCLCYHCRENNDNMYYMIREGLARYKYDKQDDAKERNCGRFGFTKTPQ